MGIGRWAGSYHARELPGFVEIVWANSEDEKRTRSSMGQFVPPILFRSRESVDFLTMWHQISGMDFKVDRILIEDARKWDRNRLIQESDPEMPSGESLGKPFELGFLRFETQETLSIDEFMPKLAAHVGGLAEKRGGGWVFQQFERNERGLKLVEECFTRIKGYQPEASEYAEILSRIGALALPEILREFKSPQIAHDIESQVEKVRKGTFGDKVRKGTSSYIDDGVEAYLIDALFWIKSPKRDEALLNALQAKLLGTRNRFNELAIAKALAFSGCKKAIPLIEQLVGKYSDDPEQQAEITTALHALGVTSPSSGRGLSISVADGARSAMDTDTGKQIFELIKAVLSQCNQAEPGMQIHEAVMGRIPVVRGTYTKRLDNNGHWAFEIPVLRPDRAVVRFSYVCGPLCSGGFLGRIKRVNGNWIVTAWGSLWLS